MGTDSALSAPWEEVYQRSWLEASFCYTDGWAEPRDFVVVVRTCKSTHLPRTQISHGT